MNTLVATDTLSIPRYFVWIATFKHWSRLSMGNTAKCPTSRVGLNTDGISRRYARVNWWWLAKVNRMFLQLCASRTVFFKDAMFGFETNCPKVNHWSKRTDEVWIVFDVVMLGTKSHVWEFFSEQVPVFGYFWVQVGQSLFSETWRCEDFNNVFQKHKDIPSPVILWNLVSNYQRQKS